MPEFTGINHTTGKHLTGAEHLKQSIRDILTTRIGTRCMRRQYGSRLPELVDNPMGEALKVELYAATAEALARWEPRFRLDRVYLQDATEAGRIVLALEGRILLNNEPVRFEGIEIT
jgi:phage baseplate assembly protein W